VLASVLSLALLSGCQTSGRYWIQLTWAGDYEAAEKRFHKSGRDLLIAYRHARPGEEDHLPKLLSGSTIKPLLEPYVCAMLFDTYEPDRRYVAQYGVERAPALIIVRQDGTYHARSGPLDEAALRDFFTTATGPGATPVYNPHLPRRVAYSWYGNVPRAREEAQRRGQPLLVVCGSFWSGDGDRLVKYFAAPGLHARCLEWVHARWDWYWPWPAWGARPFGVQKLPAIVVVQTDGTPHTLEGPTCAAQIMRFLDGLPTVAVAQEPAAVPTPVETSTASDVLP